MPTIAMSSDPKIGFGKKFMVRSIPAAGPLGRLITTFFLSKGYRRIGVVVAENSYVQGLFDGLRKELESKGVTVDLLEQSALTQQDFRTTIAKLKSTPRDPLGVLLISGQLSTFYRQLADQGVNVPTFSADFLGSKSEIAAAGRAVEGAVYPDLGVAEPFRKEQHREGRKRHPDCLRRQCIRHCGDGGGDIRERSVR